MLKIEKTVLPSPEQWEIMIEGMRNPKNSWHLMDSKKIITNGDDVEAYDDCPDWGYEIGANDHKLMMGLAKGGAVHAKYRRMIPVFLTIDAPLYWWKEFDAYKVGTVANSCSTMHKIHAKEFTLDDFSHEHLTVQAKKIMGEVITELNKARDNFLDFVDYWPEDEEITCKKDFWWLMIQLLPSSYNQKRTVMLNYEVLAKMYVERKNHKLDEWHTFCDWIEQLPYPEIIIGGGLSV